MANLSDFLQPIEGMQFINETIVSSSAATVDITSGIDSTFDLYMLSILGVVGDSDNFSINFRFFTSGTLDSTTSYASNNSDSSAEIPADNSGLSLSSKAAYVTHPNALSYGRLFIIRPSVSEFTFSESVGAVVGSDAGTLVLRPPSYRIGLFAKTNTVDGVRFFELSGNNFTAGTFRLYGIKN